MNGLVLALLVALGGGLGASVRFLIDASILARARAQFPWGTWLINLSGSFVLGLIVGPLSGMVWGPALTVGLLGGYTTFSSASLEGVTLAEDGKWGRALFYGFGTLVLAVLAALAGLALTGSGS
ncbi:fluoride efflux transporter FluC [Actinomyces minihominis]|uniref:fluoride efflux transporter FluC n=1 Tax=Actinomyces minihominis TaxID=2002838 RepID=UPI000C07971B|nr:CrcB family protein [Actinomyces minihominis]